MAWLPKSLRIGYEDYRVEEMPADSDDEGECDTTHYRIKIKIGRSSRAVANTLLHETGHGIFEHAGLHKIDGMTDEKEEMIVSAFANGLSQVMRDNPEAMRRILKMASSK